MLCAIIKKHREATRSMYVALQHELVIRLWKENVSHADKVLIRQIFPVEKIVRSIKNIVNTEVQILFYPTILHTSLYTKPNRNNLNNLVDLNGLQRSDRVVTPPYNFSIFHVD